MSLYHRVTSPNDVDGMANNVDPDQTAPPGAVWSGSALFAQDHYGRTKFSPNSQLKKYKILHETERS